MLSSALKVPTLATEYRFKELNMTDDFTFSNLSPNVVLNNIEALGFRCDGRLFELNSFENRVFQVGIEDEPPLIAKFYRPGRWTDEQILEEHSFTLQLEEEEIPAIAPLTINHRSLFEQDHYRFALYTRQGGYPPELENEEQLESIGRTIGRIHAFGSTQLYRHRETVDIKTTSINSRQLILDHFVPKAYKANYEAISDELLLQLQAAQPAIAALPHLRLHGDCHLGNILWQAPKPFFLDFDDSFNGPQIADIWLLFSKSDDSEFNQRQLNRLLNGYELFYSFDDAQLAYTEIFRAFRILNYTAWIGKRWQDPAFPKAFQWFNSDSFWRDHLRDLQLQNERMQQKGFIV